MNSKFAAAFKGFNIILILIMALVFQININSQSRIQYNGKDIFLSGINAAWVNFASDLGPNPPGLSQFRKEFQTVRDSGGNTMRLWLFTNGDNTPAYNNNGFVSGPGTVAIQNLKQILALAHHYNIGMILCLWSFDMLRVTEVDSARLHANIKMITDSAYTAAFIKNALIPMVDSVKDDPAVLAWEVCNEPNGMTTGMNYYSTDPTVSSYAVRKFTNLIAGAIHRIDPNALVTTGPGSFQTLTDVNPIAKASAAENVNLMSQQKLQNITDVFNAGHYTKLTVQQMKEYLLKIAGIPDSNYYSDNRLIAAGGDSLGTLDFYCVHYYYYGSSLLSPFTHPFSTWNLPKPTVVAEFYMQNTDGFQDVDLYSKLYNNGYAGALAWSWTDFPNTPNNSNNAASDTWKSLRFLHTNFKSDIDPFNTNFPKISILSPQNNTYYSDSTEITINCAVVDTGEHISYVDFFANDSLLGTIIAPSDSSADTVFYSFTAKNIAPGNYYLTAITENKSGQQAASSIVQISMGTGTMTKLEAENAVITGSGITVQSDPTASGGKYLDIQTNDTTATVTWNFTNNSTVGMYPITFGFKLNYNTPKDQYINVNGKRTDTVEFSGSTTLWLTKTIEVNLVNGPNTVQMQMFWGWMSVDYLAVPANIVTSNKTSKEIPSVFALSQNYPNPFNPVTKIRYSIPNVGTHGNTSILINVYDVLGRKIVTLVNKKQRPGIYEVTFDGSRLASGMYIYVLRAGNHFAAKKMILLK